jgi:hypothetical protein
MCVFGFIVRVRAHHFRQFVIMASPHPAAFVANEIKPGALKSDGVTITTMYSHTAMTH